MPTRARRVMWLELESTGHTEPTIREARDYWLSALPKDVRQRIFTEASVVSFLEITETIRPTKQRLNALDMYFEAHLRSSYCLADCRRIWASFFCPFTNGFTNCGAISRTSWPNDPIARAQ